MVYLKLIDNYTYILAAYLADVRKESFSIPLEIQKSLDASNLNLDDVFAKFEGQWIFDESRGADRKSTRLNSSHSDRYRMPSSA